jgi:hypothetical protein
VITEEALAEVHSVENQTGMVWVERPGDRSSTVIKAQDFLRANAYPPPKTGEEERKP